MRLIDADKLITELKREYCEECIDDICDLCWVPEYIKYLKNAPTVEAEPVRHGHWIKGGEAYIEAQTIQEHICSICGNRTLEADNYCGRCGAKMDEEVGNE